MADEIVNRVATSALVTFDLEHLAVPGDRVLYDIKTHLFEGLILKEKDFREQVRSGDWSTFKDKYVAITCSADAIVPTWAFMLLASALQPHAARVFFGSLEEMESQLFLERLQQVDWIKFANAKVVIKGCSKVSVPVSAYVETICKLQPLASSIMFGEPCSTVPLFKRPKPL